MLCGCSGALCGAGRGAGRRATEGRSLTGRRAETRAIGLAMTCFFATGFFAAAFLTIGFLELGDFFAAAFLFPAGLAARLALAVIGFLRFAMLCPIEALWAAPSHEAAHSLQSDIQLFQQPHEDDLVVGDLAGKVVR